MSEQLQPGLFIGIDGLIKNRIATSSIKMAMRPIKNLGSRQKTFEDWIEEMLKRAGSE